MAPKHPPGSAMTLDNVRHLGVHRLVAYCLSGRVILLLVLKHLFPESDHLGIESSGLCRHLERQ
jgi:hypothetical protein